MGIQGLIPFLKNSSRTSNLHEFKGKCAGVDAYCWLHKGAFSCAEKLAKGEPTDGYVAYFMKQVSLLLSFDIKPIAVFDGCRLPSKSITEAKRRENREKNKHKGKEYLREGKMREARECFQRCVDVTSEMAHQVIKACRQINVDVLVAPFEADAQLAFLDKKEIADFIITEDSDLILFGCKKVMFKLDGSGGGILMERSKLHLSMGLSPDKFKFEKFCIMCVLSGCDYLPSLKGIGLGKAKKFVTLTNNPDILSILSKLPSYLNMPSLEISEEYKIGFKRALNTIHYQLVFDPVTRTLQPLNPYPEGLDHKDFTYCGEFFSPELALQIALGNVDVQTKVIVDDYDPSIPHNNVLPKSSSWQKKVLHATHKSIWCDGPLKTSKDKLNSEDNHSSHSKSAFVKIPKAYLKKRKLDASTGDEKTNEELKIFYNMDKKSKLENSEKVTQDEIVPKSIVKNKLAAKETSLTPQAASKLRNPFKKSPITSDEKVDIPKPINKSGFSALNSFSYPNKTVIVRSRYFMDSPTTSKETLLSMSTSKMISNATTSPDIPTLRTCGNSAFKWSINSSTPCNKNSLNESPSNSDALRKEFHPPKLILPETPPDSQKNAVFNNVQISEGEKENEENLDKQTPTKYHSPVQILQSCSYFSENVRDINVNAQVEDEETLNLVKESPSMKKSCRLSGLSHSKGSNLRQLNLKDMFSFKRKSSKTPSS